MKRLAILLLCITPPVALLSVGAFQYFARTWPGVEYAEVRAYAWPDKGHSYYGVVSKDMALAEGAYNPDGTLLSADQIKRLVAALTVEHPYSRADCYEPHNAFIFYNRDGKPVASVEICFDCQGTRNEPGGAARDVDLPALAAIFKELNLPAGGLK